MNRGAYNQKKYSLGPGSTVEKKAPQKIGKQSHPFFISSLLLSTLNSHFFFFAISLHFLPFSPHSGAWSQARKERRALKKMLQC